MGGSVGGITSGEVVKAKDEIRKAVIAFVPNGFLFYFVCSPMSQTYMKCFCGLGVLIPFATHAILASSNSRQINRILKARMWIYMCALLAAVIYWVSYVSMVHGVEGTNVKVVAGFERTEWAKTQYPDFTDGQLLHEIGATEDHIDKIWTPLSVRVSEIWLSLVFCCVVNLIYISVLIFIWSSKKNAST